MPNTSVDLLTDLLANQLKVTGKHTATIMATNTAVGGLADRQDRTEQLLRDIKDAADKANTLKEAEIALAEKADKRAGRVARDKGKITASKWAALGKAAPYMWPALSGALSSAATWWGMQP